MIAVAKVFISHSSRDKAFARQIAQSLIDHDHSPWLDEWEIRVGESITRKIEEGLGSTDFIAVILSPHSVQSNWVEREWQAKFWDEIKHNRVTVLPVLKDVCEIPKLISDKKYADFSNNFDSGLTELLIALNPDWSPQDLLPHGQENIVSDVSDFIRRLHSSEPLSALLVDVMEFARRNQKSKIYDFCRLEISGYYDVEEEEGVAQEIRPYRVIDFFASKQGKLNPNFMLFNTASGLFNYIDNNPDLFVPVYLLESNGVGHIEDCSYNKKTDTTALHMSRRLGDLNPEAKNQEQTVYLYAHPDSYDKILKGIRTRLNGHLTSLLPMLD
jgi:hypothetical protein